MALVSAEKHVGSGGYNSGEKPLASIYICALGPSHNSQNWRLLCNHSFATRAY
jgi:hypothetical protein